MMTTLGSRFIPDPSGEVFAEDSEEEDEETSTTGAPAFDSIGDHSILSSEEVVES